MIDLTCEAETIEMTEALHCRRMSRRLRRAAALATMLAAGPLMAQEASSLETGLHAVLAQGDLLDVRAVSNALGLELYLPQSESSVYGWRATVTRVPPTMYASVSYTVRVNKAAMRTRVELNFVPRSCAGLREWASAWKRPVQSVPLMDAGGISSSLHWAGPESVSFAATYFPGGSCLFSLWQIVPGIVPPRFTEPPPHLPDTRLDQQLAELVRHDDLRDFRATASILNAALYVQPSDLREGRLYVARPWLAQIIPGVRADGFHYYTNDSGWVSSSAFYALGQKHAERYAELDLAFDTDQACLPPERIPASLARLGIVYRATTDAGDPKTITYVTESVNPIRIFLSTTLAHEGRCVGHVALRQTTDPTHSINVPVEFSPQEALEAGHLSAAVLQQLDLIGQSLQGRVVKSVVLATHAVAGASASAPSDPVLTQLMGLLRAALIDRGLRVEDIKTTENVPTRRDPKAGASVTVDILVE